MSLTLGSFFLLIYNKNMFYLLNKPKGITSFKFINSFARERGIKKIGHTGTLDPLASGALLVATGQDTKLIDYVDKGFKSYKATMVLGVNTTTYDSEGEVTEKHEVNVSEEKVIEAIKSFERTYDQIPPNFSAKKINGVRAYKLARENKEVILKANKVTIKSIKDIKQVSKDTYTFTVEVSRGTYIRSLIFDIGKLLNTGAHMSELERITIGPLVLKQDIEEVSVLDLLTIDTLEINELDDLRFGRSFKLKAQDGTYALIHKNEIIGVGNLKSSILKPIKVFLSKFPQK